MKSIVLVVIQFVAIVVFSNILMFSGKNWSSLNTCSGTNLYMSLIMLVIFCATLVMNDVLLHREWILATCTALHVIFSWACFLINSSHNDSCPKWPNMIWHLHNYFLNAGLILLGVLYSRKCKNRPSS